MFSILLTKYTEAASPNEWAYPSTALAQIPPGPAWLDRSQNRSLLFCEHRALALFQPARPRAANAERRCSIPSPGSPNGPNPCLLKQFTARRNYAGERRGWFWERVEEKRDNKGKAVSPWQAAKPSSARGQVTCFQSCADILSH